MELQRRTAIEANVIRIAFAVMTLIAEVIVVAGFDAPERASYAGFVVLGVLASIVVWRYPRPAVVVAWGAYLWIVLAPVISFDVLDLRVFEISTSALALLALVIVPGVAVVYAITIRIRDARNPPPSADLPIARAMKIQQSR